MARAALGIGVRQLADIANVSAMTVTRFENGHTSGSPETLTAIRAALEAAGVVFLSEGETADGGPGVRLKG